MKTIDWKLQGDIFKYNIKKNFQANRITQKMNRQPRAAESSLSLELFY